MNKTQYMSKTGAYILLAVGALIMLSPFYFMFVYATHSRNEIFQVPPPLFFGNDFLLNMQILLKRIPFWTNLSWSIYVAIMSTVLTLLFCSMGGYAFAIYDFKFKKIIFSIVMVTMLIPPFLGMIPTFMIMNFLGWINQPKALYIPGAASAFGIFLMRQFISSSIPKELVEAARIDGASELRIYWSVILPLLSPVMGTLGLVTFIASWNNFIGPLIIMHGIDKFTLPLALRAMQSPVDTEWGALMAGSVIAVIPLLIIFAMTSRRLISGLTAGAVRG